MKLEKVTVNYERKINLGDYNSANLSCMLTAFIEPDDNTDQVMNDLWEMARNNVKKAAVPFLDKVKATENQIFLGLPQELREKIKQQEDKHSAD